MATEAKVEEGKTLTVLDIGRVRALAKRLRNVATDLDRECAALEAQLVGLDGDRLTELGIGISVERSTS
jgi:hypothetical protein